MEMELLSLDEFNRKRLDLYEVRGGPRPNGIACPECGQELFDTDRRETLMSNPPKTRIHCACGYTGYRIA